MIADSSRVGELGFWRAVRLILELSRKRAIGRQKRQKELLGHRSGKKALDWSGFIMVVAVLVMVLLNLGAAYFLHSAVEMGQRIQMEKGGKIVVSDWFLDRVTEAEKGGPGAPPKGGGPLKKLGYVSEARDIVTEEGGVEKKVEKNLRDSVIHQGSKNLLSEDKLDLGLEALPRTGRLPEIMGSIVLLWWWLMLVFQGEGLELDLQRRKHPMWEWLFSHPISPGAIFMAEMLSPIASNPIYCASPVFVGLVYGLVYGGWLGFLAALLIGVPLVGAAAGLGKALEIGALLRFAPRSRGAMIGLMSWFGYASMMLLIIGALSGGRVLGPIGRVLEPWTTFSCPGLALFLGQSDHSFSFLSGAVFCWAFSAIVIGFSVWFTVWGAQRGLGGAFGKVEVGPSLARNQSVSFGRAPLYRKEFLWFIRDRSAIVQAILIPVTAAGYEIFNFRGFLTDAQGEWNYICGVGVLFGTYFLSVLGPKSLSSEGPALWITLTWSHGLEELLKAKAWLWSLISTGMVGLILLYAIFLFPAEIWKVVLVGIGWFFFSRSMAEKTVTLVSAASSSGESERIPVGRRMSASLGMLTFSIGVITQQWSVAVMGIVYSHLTAAAMWQNFRARLPFLYDPWSEKLPPAPTLMHAMIAISILVDLAAISLGSVIGLSGREHLAIWHTVIYGLCAAAVSIGMTKFLEGRDVPARDVWCWRHPGEPAKPRSRMWCGDGTRGLAFFLALSAAVAGGSLLALFAHGYTSVLRQFPWVSAMLTKGQEEMGKTPEANLSLAIIGICFAPIAEEYLFRGLLFRALDREWGGWKAILGSALFFAIYHSFLFWLPVGLVGLACALLFKKTGSLVPSVLLHLIYNSWIFLGKG